MKLVLKPNGKVLLNDNCKPQTSETSPPVGDCCCDDGPCYTTNFREEFDDDILPEDWTIFIPGPGFHWTVQDGHLIFYADASQGEGWIQTCIRTSMLAGLFTCKVKFGSSRDLNGIIPSSIEFEHRLTMGDAWIEWADSAFSGFSRWWAYTGTGVPENLIDQPPGTDLSDDAEMHLIGVDAVVTSVKYYVGGALKYTFTPAVPFPLDPTSSGEIIIRITADITFPIEAFTEYLEVEVTHP